MATIVLAHGVFGFGDPFGLSTFLNYFNGVAEHLRRGGHEVFVPQVNPFGSIAQRGSDLAEQIQRRFPDHGAIHVIAHSMGGLDARHAITNVFRSSNPIKTLVTIGTPHRGSPVADAIARKTDPLFAHIPAILFVPLERNTGALHELTTDFGEHFDETTLDVKGVRYIEAAGDASKGGHELFLFQLAAIIGRLKGEVNDGVVTESSAIRGGTRERIPNWPVDHAGEVGWSFPLSNEHLPRYDAIADMLK